MIAGQQTVLFMLLAVLMPGAGTSCAESAVDCRQWRHVRDTAEGPVFHRCRPGSTVAEVMIQTRFQTAPEHLYTLVNDYGAFGDFIPNVVESRVLERVGPVQWVYHHLHFPGPVADRAYVMKSTGSIPAAPGNAWRVDWALSERVFPRVDMTAGILPDSFSGFWEIEPGDGAGMTRARYALHADPGGLVPGWLVVRMTDRYVQQVIAAIRRQLEE